MGTLWGQNTQRIELPSCKSWKLNWHVSNSLSFYSRYDCGFHHLVLGAISAVGRHSCRMRQLSSDYPCPWNTRPTRYFSDRFFKEENISCFPCHLWFYQKSFSSIRYKIPIRKFRVSLGSRDRFGEPWINIFKSLCKSEHWANLHRISLGYTSRRQTSDWSEFFDNSKNLFTEKNFFSIFLDRQPPIVGPADPMEIWGHCNQTLT